MSEKRAFTAIAADVRSAQNGDGEAMNRILADVQDMVYYNCLKMLRDEQAAQDTTQEILIAVYQKLGALSDPQAYVGWVKRITANLCKNRLCKVNREFLLSVNEDGEDPFADFEDTDEQRIPDKALDNEETRRMIADLVDRLPDEQRMCVLLYYYDELKTHEIAETLKVSEGTIKSRLNYARKSIREGVRAYEKAGVKLYGFSPIPFLAYFLGKAAASTVSPVAAASITGASTATAATAATASTASAASAGGIGAFLATTAGKVVAGIAAAVVLGGAVTGTVIATRSPKESVPAIVQTETEQPSETPVVVHTAAPSAQQRPRRRRSRPKNRRLCPKRRRKSCRASRDFRPAMRRSFWKSCIRSLREITHTDTSTAIRLRRSGRYTAWMRTARSAKPMHGSRVFRNRNCRATRCILRTGRACISISATAARRTADLRRIGIFTGCAIWASRTDGRTPVNGRSGARNGRRRMRRKRSSGRSGDTARRNRGASMNVPIRTGPVRNKRYRMISTGSFPVRRAAYTITSPRRIGMSANGATEPRRRTSPR